MLNNEPFYLVDCMILAPFWLYMVFQKKHRRDMLLLGIIFGIAAILTGKYFDTKDYWNPNYILGASLPIEDFLYGLFFGGVSAELAEFSLMKSTIVTNTKRILHHTRYIIVFLIVILLSFALCSYFKLNSIIAHIIPPLIIGVIVSIKKRGSFKIALLNGGLVTIVTCIVFMILQILFPGFIQKYWLLNNLSGLFFGFIPIEELLFAFALGFGAAEVYEFIFEIE